MPKYVSDVKNHRKTCATEQTCRLNGMILTNTVKNYKKSHLNTHSMDLWEGLKFGHSLGCIFTLMICIIQHSDPNFLLLIMVEYTV